jgi:hypothetical protein
MDEMEKEGFRIAKMSIFYGFLRIQKGLWSMKPQKYGQAIGKKLGSSRIVCGKNI